MDKGNRKNSIVRKGDVAIETYMDGTGPAIVVLPSYGRDGGEDFDRFTRIVAASGFSVLRPQPRGVGASKAPLDGASLREQASDVAMVIRELVSERAIVLGHAFGNIIARVLAIDHPDLTKGVILAAASASRAPENIEKTPFIAGDLTAPEDQRLAALRLAFFAPSHDPRPWLAGWYPETLKMQKDAVHAVRLSDFSSAGTAPLFEIIAESDPFKPYELWRELRDQCGNRVVTQVVTNASHALFPEQPEAVAQIVIQWSRALPAAS